MNSSRLKLRSNHTISDQDDDSSKLTPKESSNYNFYIKERKQGREAYSSLEESAKQIDTNQQFDSRSPLNDRTAIDDNSYLHKMENSQSNNSSDEMTYEQFRDFKKTGVKKSKRKISEKNKKSSVDNTHILNSSQAHDFEPTPKETNRFFKSG